MNAPLLPSNIDFSASFPTLSRRLRLGVVGGGRISVTQATAARMSGYWDIAAGALSSKPQVAKQKGTLWRLAEDRCYTSYHTMAQAESMRADGIDAVMVTTPNNLHYDVAKTFLQAGIHVVCDKPLTNQYEEAKELVQLTETLGCVFGVGYAMACFPMVRQAKEMIKMGAIGEIRQIHAEFMQDWMMNENVTDSSHVQWRLDPKISGPTSCTGDIATHAYHLASFVSGLNATSLRGEMYVCGQQPQLEDTVMMMVKYAGDVPGTIIATRLASGNRAGLRLRIFGSKGAVEWDLEKPEILKYNLFGQPDQILSRGPGHGILPKVTRLTRLARGFSEGVIEAWGNLYTEFAIAVAARKDGVEIPPDWLDYPNVQQGAQGVRFVEAVVKSHDMHAKAVDL